jgi:LDH2 family malate/lactate/ureidoglycolate dehydrogenase
MKIVVQELKDRISSVLKNINESDRGVIADYMIWAEMTGNKTQGIIKLSGTDPIQNIIPESEIKIERETKVSALLNAGKNPAILVSEKAAEIAIKKAKEIGISIVGARNFFSSNGSQAYYARKIAEHDLIGIMCSRSPGSVSAFGSIDPLFGTNPIGYAFPTTDEPITFDAAMSAMTFYGLVVAKSKGEQIPSGVATDINGNPTTDPAAVIDGGAINPFGNSYKASGLAMLVELLAGPMIGGAFLDYKTFDKEWGAVIIAIDPGMFGDIKEFKKNCSEFVNVIKNSRTRAHEEIRMPHDYARQNYATAAAVGTVEIDDAIYKNVFGE